MGLLSFFSRQNSGAAPSADAVEQARTRARRRLIGAVVLVGLGIIGFPLLFETQPRPIPVDVPIEIPRKDAVPPLTLPPTPTPSARAASATARGEVTSESAIETVRPPLPAEPLASAPKPAVAAKPIDKPAPPVAKGAPPAAKPVKPETSEKPSASAGSARMVVQVGAFADANAARDVRRRVEKLGLEPYTQVVDTEAGKRIRVRVGPFASREQADQAAGRIKSAGLPAAVIGP